MAAASVQPPGFPVDVKVTQATVGGHPTDLVASKYADGTLLMVSQIGAFGTVVLARCGAPASGGACMQPRNLLSASTPYARYTGHPQASCGSCQPPACRGPSSTAPCHPLHRAPRRRDASAEGRSTFSTQVLLGRRDEPLITLAARQLVELAAEAGNTK